MREADEVVDFVVRLWASRKCFEQELVKEPASARLVPRGMDPCETNDDSYMSRLFKYLCKGGESLALGVLQKSIAILNGEHEFKELGNQKYVEGVFRYLDTDGNGMILESEWNILAQLWKEVMLTVQEFAKCIARNHDFRFTCLDEAWTTLDINGDDSVSAKEFDSGAFSMQFLGASRVVFKYLQMCSQAGRNAPKKINRASFQALRPIVYSAAL